ncbi:MAG: adenylate/guanylate cyclase domain-containing protein [Proteobacteria bacterium]|nr:adenylate/guanylate cyclase domain-containing protein [Pseudomonadota bacterium]
MANEADRHSSVVERKLVTILSADVAEYSRLMAEDEEQTLRTFREHSQTFRALVDMHHGRIFNTAGDALLAEFTSPIEAVRCATDIQAALRTRNDLLPRARQVRFRIGVNLGDVMMQGSDLLGDGVNVAARLQGAAEPGGICISGSVYDQIRNKLSLSIESLGERRFKNIPQPVRTFTIAGTEDDGALPVRKKSSLVPGLWVKSAVAALSRLSIPRGHLVKSAVAVLALLALAGGYWAYSAYPRSPARQTNTSPKPTVAPTKANVTALDALSSALLADAQLLNRPQKEIDGLTDSNTKIAAMASQLHGLGAKTGDKTKVQSLLADMKNLAVDMSHTEATALDRAGAQSWQDLQKLPGKSIAADAAAALANAQKAKTDLDNAIAAAQQAQDGSLSLKATRKALAAYDAFDKAGDAAAPFFISARRSDFTVLAAAARNISVQVISYGRVKKPWLLASRARKDAYQTLADNATEAQSEVAQLDELERRGNAATSLRKISASLGRASTIKARLGRMLVSSQAAYSVFNQ